jgi:hypothetical protein
MRTLPVVSSPQGDRTEVVALALGQRRQHHQPRRASHVAVDVQVRKVTEYLGVTEIEHLDLDRARPLIQRAWANAVASGGAVGPDGIAGSAAALDPALRSWVK